jgi:hypothetical protein
MSKTCARIYFRAGRGVHTSFAISVSVGLTCRGCSTLECLKCVGQFESGRMQAPFSGLDRRLKCRRIVAVERCMNAMRQAGKIA